MLRFWLNFSWISFHLFHLFFVIMGIYNIILMFIIIHYYFQVNIFSIAGIKYWKTHIKKKKKKKSYQVPTQILYKYILEKEMRCFGPEEDEIQLGQPILLALGPLALAQLYNISRNSLHNLYFKNCLLLRILTNLFLKTEK